MSKFKLVATKLWISFMCPIWSFIVNLFYWICRPFAIKEALAKKKALLSIDNITNVMTVFRWTEDKYKDWLPWVITIVNKDITDDCDGAAVLAKWWWKEKGVKSRIVYLYSADGKSGHAVCILVGNGIFVSNSQVVDLDPTNWQQDLLSRFNNKYDTILER
jgi:hypothetical protein